MVGSHKALGVKEIPIDPRRGSIGSKRSMVNERASSLIRFCDREKIGQGREAEAPRTPTLPCLVLSSHGMGVEKEGTPLPRTGETRAGE